MGLDFSLIMMMMVVCWSVGQSLEPGKEMIKSDGSEPEKSFLIRFKNFVLPIVMNFSHPCSPTTELIILTMSRRNGFVKRNAMRQTWLKDSLRGQSQRFLIADAPPTEVGGEVQEVQSELEAEQRDHGDLVFLHGFVDLYAHIHLKWYAGLLWQQEYCRQAEWVLKADDDAVVHLARLDYWIGHKFRRIAEELNGLVYFGSIYRNSRAHRDKKSKWYVSESVYPDSVYPDFAQGSVYLATNKTIAAIFGHTDEIVGFYLDDVVFTGMLAEKANVTRWHQQQHFFTRCKKVDICENGVPTFFSNWPAEDLEMSERIYGELKSAKCVLELNNGVEESVYCP